MSSKNTVNGGSLWAPVPPKGFFKRWWDNPLAPYVTPIVAMVFFVLPGAFLVNQITGTL